MPNMDSYDIGRLAYLVLLGAAVGGYFIVANRRSWGKMAREMAVWALIFLGAIAGYGLWADVRDDIVPRQSFLLESGEVSVPRSPDGHYYLTLDVNGTPIRFVVDTGATEVVLSRQDAARAGLRPDRLAYLGRAQTANGTVTTASVRLESLELEGITDRNFPVEVNGGEMRGSLLGMRYLDRFSSVEISDGRLILTR